MRRRLPDLLIIFGLFFLPLAFFWQVTLGPSTLLPADNLYQYAPWSGYRAGLGVPETPHNALLSDLVLENYQWKMFIREALAARELPLWNPYLFAGVPFLAAGQHSALYPFSVLYYVLPLDKAYGWFTVSQLWLAGVLMYLFMRGLGVRQAGAAFAAVAYQFSAFFLASVVFQMIIAAAAWLPFLLLMCEFVIQRRPLFGRATVLPWIAGGAFGLGMCIFAGHVEIVYYSLLVMGGWCAWRLLAEVRKRPLVQTLQTGAALLALVALGVGVGAVQVLPLAELAGRNFREGSADFATVRSYAFPPRHALAFLAPNLFGSPAEHDYTDIFTLKSTPVRWQRADGNTVTDTFWEVNKNYVEGACYVGLATLLLAGLSLLEVRRKPFRLLLAALSALCVSFAFGTPTYALLYYGLPGVNQLHSPFRWVWPLTFALAVLAGFGVDMIAHARLENADIFYKRARRAVAWVGGGAVAVGALTLIGLLASRVFFNTLRPAIESLFKKLAGADAAFPNVEAFYSLAFKNILLFAVLLLASGGAILLSRSRRALPARFGSIPLWECAIIGVIAADLMIASAGFNPAADPKWLNFEPSGVTFLKKQDPATWRFISIEATGHSHTLNANSAMKYGLADVGGYDSIIPRQYVEYMARVQPQGMLIYNRIAPIIANQLAPLASSELAALATRYAVSEVPISAVGWTQVFADRGFYVYENANALARVRVDTPGSNATITQSGLNQVTIDATAAQDKTRLTLADSMFPGWRAFIRPVGTPENTEREIPVTLADGNFRAVELPAGSWTVRFRYTPQSVQFGAVGTFVAVLVLLFMLFYWLWRRFVADTKGDLARIARNSGVPVLLSLFNKAIDFVFAAAMLRILTRGEAGAFYYAVVIIGWFEILGNFGLNTYLTREVARDRGAAGFYLRRTSVLRLRLIVAWVPLLLLFFAYLALRPADAADQALNGQIALSVLVFYLALIPASLNSGLSALFYAFEKAEFPAFLSTFIAILNLVIRLAVLLFGGGIIGLAFVSLFLSTITYIIMRSGARQFLRSEDARPAISQPESSRTILAESWPLLLNHLLATVFFKIDVVLLEHIKSKDVVAQYSTSYKWIDALGVIPSFFTMAMLPILSRQAATDRDALRRTYFLAVKLLVMVAVPVAVVTTFLAPTLVGILGGAAYVQDGTRALQIMIWFAPIGWINSLTQYVLIALNLQRPLRGPFIAGVLFNIVANLLFIPLFSYQASAFITILSEGVLLIGFALLLRPALGPVPFARLLWKLAAAGAIMAALMAVGWALTPLLGLALGVVGYPAALLILQPFDHDEQSRLMPLLPGPLRRAAITVS